MAGRGSLSKRPPGSAQRRWVARFGQSVQRQDPEAEVVDRCLANDGVARDPGLPAAHRHFARGLALERLLVEAALARYDECRGPHARVEAERVEDERSAGHEARAALRVEPAREAAAGTSQRYAAWVARRLGRERVEAPL